MLGIKKPRPTSMLGVKQYVSRSVLGQKTYGQVQNILGRQPDGNHANGMVNESHGTMMDREPLKQYYNPPKSNKSGIERK